MYSFLLIVFAVTKTKNIPKSPVVVTPLTKITSLCENELLYESLSDETNNAYEAEFDLRISSSSGKWMRMFP